MSAEPYLILFLTLSELALIVLVVVFFSRLRRSEGLLHRMQNNQEQLLEKLRVNAQLEQELVSSFKRRHAELLALDEKLEERRAELERLLKQAREMSRSPQFLRQVIQNGHKKGQSIDALARSTGLAPDEVRLILEQAAS
ncbi:hypothetical protein G3N56_10160 [Desulfovibrio sulfodismutans]|uniref:DUF2802 domain-containing protein n=1 Tax=Desulfolutivibrio sulfodismutans TaxID=63561 RepID=A0A7K3NLM7_9BACT|nr:hypothetical protein [Desulfolutivibrio sulfodismutans]NDY57104.1 hypothetical protein [Desulfolutivibrio sulfodismutans]QLA11731.1 hypothetical protein GD606_05335 [Desulfolutivibrio sulfodismutans DSM 3696]